MAVNSEFAFLRHHNGVFNIHSYNYFSAIRNIDNNIMIDEKKTQTTVRYFSQSVYSSSYTHYALLFPIPHDIICILIKLNIHNIEFWVFDACVHKFVGSLLKAVRVKCKNISIISVLKNISSAKLLD